MLTESEIQVLIGDLARLITLIVVALSVLCLISLCLSLDRLIDVRSAHAHAASIAITQPPPATVEINTPFTVVQQVTGPARMSFGIGGCDCFSITSMSISPPELAPAPLGLGDDRFWTGVDVPDGVTATYTLVLEARELGALSLTLNDATYTVQVTRPGAPRPPRRTWLPLIAR